jgi:hypothetical protein
MSRASQPKGRRDRAIGLLTPRSPRIRCEVESGGVPHDFWGELLLQKQTLSLVLALACCSCSALPKSQFAVRCSGSQSAKSTDYDTPTVSQQVARTYVVDEGRKTLYRVDPYVIANLCALNGRCDLEVTPARVTALMTKSVGSGRTRQTTEGRFVLDRAKGELRIDDVMTFYMDDERQDPMTTESIFTCATVPVPDFKVPEV